MSVNFNYRHLYYFWVVAKEGGISRAAERLGMAVQTVSTQVRELERSLGCMLLKPVGRGVTLTDAGIVAVRQAEQIFEIGDRLPATVRDAAGSPKMRFAVGIPDGLPKLVIRQLIEPVLQERNLRLLCHEGPFEDLLGDLALHRLDLVIADRAAAPNPNIKLYNHSLGSSPIAWYAPASLYATARRAFPRSLAKVPVLLPTNHAAARTRINQWFERYGIEPLVCGEFQDSALLKTFGASGMGVFPAAEMMQEDLIAQYRVRRLGPCDGVEEQIFAIGPEKKVLHPLVQKILSGRK
jgi:LysR family transcriptional regulator, transcriptional activator of nhaA